MPDKPTVPTDEELATIALNLACSDVLFSFEDPQCEIREALIQVRDRTREATLNQVSDVLRMVISMPRDEAVKWLEDNIRAAEEARK